MRVTLSDNDKKNILLRDDNSIETGGISHPHQTLYEFLQEINCENADELNSINWMLFAAGIEKIKLSELSLFL